MQGHLRLTDILLSLTVVTCWGLNFVAAKFAMQYYPPMFVTFLRFFLVAVLLLPFVKMPRGRLKEIARLSPAFGVLHFGLTYTGMSMGMDIATTVLTTQLGVPFSCLLGAIFLKDRLGPWRSFGMAIAFFGIGLVAGEPNVAGNFTGFLLVMCGSFAWATSNIQMKKMGEVAILPLLAYASLFSVPQMLLATLLLEGPQFHLLASPPLIPTLGLLYSVIFSTIVAYGLWYYLLRHNPISRVAPFNLLNPVVGIGSGMLVFGETLSWQVVVGGALALCGVAIIIFRRPRTVEMGE